MPYRRMLSWYRSLYFKTFQKFWGLGLQPLYAAKDLDRQDNRLRYPSGAGQLYRPAPDAQRRASCSSLFAALSKSQSGDLEEKTREKRLKPKYGAASRKKDSLPQCALFTATVS
jgi:hypothetical protein